MDSLPDGTELEQFWDAYGIARSVFASFIGSLAAVVVIDHSRWRKDESTTHPVLLRFPLLTASIALGIGGIWSMHFLGMAADSIENGETETVIEKSFSSGITAASAIAVVFCIFVGFKIACRDIFAGSDRVDNLRKYLLDHSTLKELRGASAQRLIYRAAYFSNLKHLLTGSFVTAAGVCVMHYIGMGAMRGKFKIDWKAGMVALSIIIAIVVSCAGFWILFRLLLWNASREFLRPVSALVIAAAVCCMHYTGMMAAEFEYNSDDSTGDMTLNDRAADGLVFMVLLMALVAQWSIAVELRAAYSDLKDISLSEMFETRSIESAGNGGIMSPGDGGSHCSNGQKFNNSGRPLDVNELNLSREGSVSNSRRGSAHSQHSQGTKDKDGRFNRSGRADDSGGGKNGNGRVAVPWSSEGTLSMSSPDQNHTSPDGGRNGISAGTCAGRPLRHEDIFTEDDGRERTPTSAC